MSSTFSISEANDKSGCSLFTNPKFTLLISHVSTSSYFPDNKQCENDTHSGSVQYVITLLASPNNAANPFNILSIALIWLPSEVVPSLLKICPFIQCSWQYIFPLFEDVVYLYTGVISVALLFTVPNNENPASPFVVAVIVQFFNPDLETFTVDWFNVLS